MQSGQDALLQEAEALRGQLEMMGRQLDLLENVKADKDRAYTTLQGLEKAKAGDEVLFPVGGNTFVTATLAENAEVLKGIGADFAMPRPLAKALEELKAELDTVDSDIQSLSQNAAQMEARYQQIAQVLQGQGGQPEQ